MAVIVRSRKLDKFVLTSLDGVDSVVSYDALRKLLMDTYGFNLFEATNLISKIRLSPAVFVDTEKTWRIISNSEQKFNAGQMFGRVFESITSMDGRDVASSQDSTSIAIKGLNMRPNELNMLGGKIKK